ncbi:MAG: hypothetical protein HQ559_14780, partial [Lentisphaerae bacterium]|nr:hypothetical protein [Lentisphaerota bacterium]
MSSESLGAAGPNKELWDKHIEDLKRSGISVELARECGIYSAADGEVLRVTGRKRTAGSGLAFPFFDPDTG